MRSIGRYKGFKFYEVTDRDLKNSGYPENAKYTQNSILLFRPDDENPMLGYEEHVADNRNEAEEFVDSYNEEINEKRSVRDSIEQSKKQSQKVHESKSKVHSSVL